MGHIREEKLALYARGDLCGEDCELVRAHLPECVECQRAITEFEYALAFLSGALPDPAAHDLAQVRTRLAERLAGQRGRQWTWWLAVATAAIALVLLTMNVQHCKSVAPERPSRVAQTEPTANARMEHAVQPAPMRMAVAHRRPRAKRKEGLRAVALLARADRPPLLKMTTYDPKVVILWEVNGGGKSE